MGEAPSMTTGSVILAGHRVLASASASAHRQVLNNSVWESLPPALGFGCINSEEPKSTVIDLRGAYCNRVRMTSGAHLVARLHVDLRRQASAVCSASR
jgi:hypothetical protein